MWISKLIVTIFGGIFQKTEVNTKHRIQRKIVLKF